MKKRSFQSLLFPALLSFFPLVLSAQLSVTKDAAGKIEQVSVAFTNQLTAENLQSIRSELQQQHNIILNLTEETFDKKGKLRAIKFSVNCNDGFNGSASSVKVPGAKKFGFSRDYRPNAATPFAIGNIFPKGKKTGKGK